ncbi:hypothetical protein KEM48_008941 [Puccinia striiformis f. sp. tritici PST-130]|nr:hypothetical protein KEM48_008941 [Puccinia striiformis f. sp. tritici PST-130]
MESKTKSEDEILEAKIIKILVKKHVKIHAKYLKAILNDDKKTILDQAQQNQLILQKLIPNKEIESYDKQKELINSLPKQENNLIPDMITSLRIEIKSLTGIASVLSQTPTPDNSADILEKLEQSEASIISNVRQGLITEVRVYVKEEVESLTTTVTTSFGGIMTQLRNMWQSNNEKFNALQHDIVEIRKGIISVDNRVAKAESNRLTSLLAHSSPTPFETVVETESKNSPSRDLPPHQTQIINEEDDRGPRLTEKEVGKLLPP